MDFWGIWFVVIGCLGAGYWLGALHQSIRMTEKFYNLRDEDES